MDDSNNKEKTTPKVGVSARVLLSHNSEQLQDPNADPAQGATPEPIKEMKHEKIIAPDTPAKEVAEPTDDTAPVKEPAKKSGSNKAAAAEKSKDSVETEETPAKDGPSETATEEDNLKYNEEAAERESKLQEYIESKKYFLPINAVARKRSAKVSFMLVVLVLLLAIVLIDFMLDTGLIFVQHVPHTHFFTLTNN